MSDKTQALTVTLDTETQDLLLEMLNYWIESPATDPAQISTAERARSQVYDALPEPSR